MRRLQLVRDGVDEGVVLLVALDLQHEEHGVDDEAGDDQRERDDADDEHGDAASALMTIQPMFSEIAAATSRTQRATKKRDRLLATGHEGSSRNAKCKIQNAKDPVRTKG